MSYLIFPFICYSFIHSNSVGESGYKTNISQSSTLRCVTKLDIFYLKIQIYDIHSHNDLIFGWNEGYRITGETVENKCSFL